MAVHPDDETLGCGGAILNHNDEADEIHWVIAAEMNVAEGFDGQTIDQRKREIDAVQSVYGFKSMHQLGISTMKVDEYGMSDLTSRISKVLIEVKPDIIYHPFKGDVHSDHRTIFNAAYSCTKSF